MYVRRSSEGYREAAPGVALRSLSHGDGTHLVEFRLSGGYELPTHAHPNEQTGYLVSGRIRLRIGAAEQEMSPGDSWSVPPGVEHGATILEDSIAVEVFSPPRTDLLPADDLA